MTYPILIFHGNDESVAYSVDFVEAVRRSLERSLKVELSGADLRVRVVSEPDDLPLSGDPIVENRIPEFGFAQVSISVAGRVLYRHPHSLRDLLDDVLRDLLRNADPAEKHWTYRLEIEGIPRRSAYRRTPEVEGAFEVGQAEPAGIPSFRIREVPEPEPEARSLSEFGLEAPGTHGTLTVVLSEKIFDEFVNRRYYSPEVEEGGFLVGKVFRDVDRSDGYLLEITGAPAAEHTGASLIHFTFTGDSFAQLRRVLQQQYPGDRLVGWYHTHLFPATDSFGLSTVDVAGHLGTFTFPWQVAGLINLDGERRTLRFYMREGGTLVQCPYLVFDDRTRYSDTSNRLGDD